MARGARGPNRATEHVSRIAQRESGVSCAPAVIADRRGCRIARQMRDDVPRDATRGLVRRAERQGDAHARGRCLAARRAPGHCSADLVVGRRRRYRLCGHRDDVRGGSGPLHAPTPPTTLKLAAVNWAEAGFPNADLRHDSDRSVSPLLLSRGSARRAGCEASSRSAEAVQDSGATATRARRAQRTPITSPTSPNRAGRTAWRRCSARVAASRVSSLAAGQDLGDRCRYIGY
jgi:hypothetical protein